MTEMALLPGGKLFVGVVRRGYGERLVSFTKRAGAKGGTVALGRGTAESGFLELMGLGDSEKDLVLTLASEAESPAILSGLRSHACTDRHNVGIVFTLDVSGILRHVAAGSMAAVERPTAPRSSPMNPASHVLITFILNRGYADDAMAAARKAGATGGTVLNARGTGKEDDVKFFGITLVPEKEILFVVVEAGKAEAILEAVKALPCLSKPGSGIAYSMAVEDFLTLGKGFDR